MEHRFSSRRSVFQSGFRALSKISGRERRGSLAILYLIVLILGAVCLTPDTLTRAWARITGSSKVGSLRWWPAQSVHAQGTGSGALNFTVFDAPGAGTGMLQGTGGLGINANGDVVGIYVNAPSASVPNLAHGFVRIAASGTITQFDAPGAGSSKNEGTFAVSINDGGVIAGVVSDASNAQHGFVRAADGTITEFDVPAAPTNVTHRGTSPTDINGSGVIAGMYATVDTVKHGFVRAANGTITTFDVPGAGTGLTEGTIPLRINAGGDVVGFYTDANHLSHGFIRTAATGSFIAPIDAPGASTSGVPKGFKFGGTIAVGIDTAGDIVGIYADTNSINHGFVRAANATITTFDVTGAGTAGLFPGTNPTGMNAGGDVAGFYADSSGVNHAFVRSFATGAITAPLDAPGAGTTAMFNGTVPFSINSSDDLTGTYVDASVVFHGFVLAASAAAAMPSFSPPAGTYTSPLMVTISDATAGATIYYTTDGSTPTTSSTVYTGPFAVNSTATIKAIAAAPGFANSAIATATYTIAAATPTFSPASGTYTSPQTVALSDGTAGATIYYTTNGTTPTTTSTKYTSTITVNSTETIEAIAAAPGLANSAVATATYTFNPDFVLSVNPSTLTIVAGQSGNATFTVTPQNGFNSQVNFTCSGLPSEAACSFNPASVTPSGAAVTSTLTVTTTAPSAAMRMLMPSSRRPTYALLLPVLAMIFGIVARPRPVPRSLQLLTLLIFLMLASGLTSCGGANLGGGNPGTPIGTSSISVSASSSGAGGVSHPVTLTITITH